MSTKENGIIVTNYISLSYIVALSITVRVYLLSYKNKNKLHAAEPFLGS